jgi:epsin
MARPIAGKALGKRMRRTAAEQQEHTGPARASKRLREKKEASAGRNGSTYAGPSTTIRNGLATPEPSSLTESQTSLPADGTPLAPKDIFPFMQLPAELRIHIYHMALHRSEPLLLHAARAEKDEEATLDDTCPVPAPAAFPSATARRPRAPSPLPDIPSSSDPVVPTILRLNQQIYKEARSVLYSNNIFTLSLSSGVHTLSTLHQRSRSLIKHVVLTIPSHHDILDGFADLVRLGLRYCWGLKTFKIIMQASLPDDGRMTHATSVYANAFHILRWLPRGCKVVLEGNVSDVVRDVVREEGRLQSVLDEVGYAKRQHQMPERH